MPSEPFAICILTWNHPELLEARLAEIDAWLPPASIRVNVLDNGGARGPVQLVYARFLNARFSLSYYRVDTNMGFGGGFNYLVEKAVGDRLVLLSDDVITQGDWITPLDAIFNREPADFLLGHRIVGWKAGWNQFGDNIVAYPEGYFLAMPRRTWNKLGGFDTRFHPNDYEDMDLGYAAKQAGMPILVAPELPIRHIGAATLGQDPGRYDNTVAMRERFAQKWNLPNQPPRP